VTSITRRTGAGDYALRVHRLLPAVLLLAACGPGAAPAAELARIRMTAQGGRLDEARAELVALDAAHPSDAAVALLAGEVATWRGMPDEGLRWLRLAAERAPGDPEPHLRAAYVLLVHPPDGDPDAEAALAEAEEALRAAGGAESADYRACRGEVAWATDDDGAAEAWFRGALELRPDCRWALHRLLQIVGARGEEAERADLHARLSAIVSGGRPGQGMENSRMPVGFCGH